MQALFTLIKLVKRINVIQTVKKMGSGDTFESDKALKRQV